MRKIITQEERDKKDSRNKVIIGVILVAIMVVSTAGYAFFNSEKTSTVSKQINFNGASFTLADDGLWHSVINGSEFVTNYNPEDTKNISTIMKLTLASYQTKPVFYTYDSDMQGISEIMGNIQSFMSRTPQAACLGNCTQDLPVKSCADNMIILKEGKESLINQQNNCVYITFKEGDGLRASDAFIFRIIGLS